MSSNPSWKWLSSRRTEKELAAQAKSKTPSRPCLPAVEQLDPRLMLAGNGDVIGEPPPKPSDSTEILIGLVKGELNLVKGELNFLKLAAVDQKLAQTPNLIHRLTESFLKIDSVLMKYGEWIVKDEMQLDKFDALTNKALSDIDTQFLKITDLVGDSQNLNGVISLLKENTSSLVNGLSGLQGGELESKDQLALLNFANKFQNAADAVLKLTEFDLARKAGGKQQEYLQVKLEDILVSSLKLNDTIKSQVDAEGIIAVLIGLLKPAENPTDLVTIVSTDDVILG
jgi:hypothetical protein